MFHSRRWGFSGPRPRLHPATWGALLIVAGLLQGGLPATVANAQVATVTAPSATVSATPGVAAAGASVAITISSAVALSAPPTVAVGGACLTTATVTLSPLGPATTYTGTYTVPPGPGDCPATVSVSDTATGSATLTVDRTSPGPTTATGTGGTLNISGWYTAAPTIALASTDATSGVAAVYYQFVPHLAAAPTNALPGAWTHYTAAFSPPNGDLDLYAFSVDQAGNAETPVAHGEFKVDTVPPVLTTTSSLKSAAAGAVVNVSVSPSEPLAATPTASISGTCIVTSSIALNPPAAGSGYAGSYTVPPGTTDCAATLTVSGTDVAGNAGTGSVSFTIDRTAPVLTTTSSRTSAAAGSTVGVTITSSEPLAAPPTVTVGGTCVTTSSITLTPSGSATTYTGNYLVPTGLGDCPATVSVSGTDQAGNPGTGSVGFTIDRTPPSLTATTSAPSATMGASITLNVGTSEPLAATPTVNITGACIPASPITLTPAAVGSGYAGTYTVPVGSTDCAAIISVSATDPAGNVGSASASVNITRAAQAQKIDPALLQQMAASSTVSLPVIVEMAHASTPFPLQPNVQLAQQGLALLQQWGTPVAGLSLLDGASGFATASGIEAISLNSSVAFVHEDSTITPRVATVGLNAAISPASLTSAYPLAVHADSVWAQGGSGAGIAVAVLDSGIAPDPDLTQTTGASRIVAAVNVADPLGLNPDPGGHGTYVAGVIAGNGTRSAGQYIGVAPGANLVDVRVIDSNGNGRVSSVIRGIEWVLAHKAQYNIRVINLSVGAPSRLPYRADPLAAAVEMAWKRGLVVVAAAGNNGSAPNAVDRPGNDPYVVTVGATDDQGTPTVTDDTLATFSSFGTPTGSTAKPDLVAPGRRLVSIRVAGSALDTLNPTHVVLATNGSTYFRASGTSASTAVVSGVVALLLEHQPTLSPDQVKAILKGTTQAYGLASTSGLVNAYAAVNSALMGSANQGLRPADAFDRTIYPILYGYPVISTDPRYQGIVWDSTVWSGIVWDGIVWDGIVWDGIVWDSLAWSNLPLDTLAWNNAAWNQPGWDSPTWSSLTLD